MVILNIAIYYTKSNMKLQDKVNQCQASQSKTTHMDAKTATKNQHGICRAD